MARWHDDQFWHYSILLNSVSLRYLYFLDSYYINEIIHLSVQWRIFYRWKKTINVQFFSSSLDSYNHFRLPWLCADFYKIRAISQVYINCKIPRRNSFTKMKEENKNSLRARSFLLNVFKLSEGSRLLSKVLPKAKKSFKTRSSLKDQFIMRRVFVILKYINLYFCLVLALSQWLSLSASLENVLINYLSFTAGPLLSTRI